MNERFIISLFDNTGSWAKPYADAGWKVLLWDHKHEGCILERFNTLCEIIEQNMEGDRLTGLLAAPPCTDFASSGSQYWNEKDTGLRWWPGEDAEGKLTQYFDTNTERSITLIEIIFVLIERYKPFFWAIENPVGRLERLVPKLKPYRKMTFDPWKFGDPYTKKTVLWGNFNADLKRAPVKPEFKIASNGDKYSKIHWNTGGGSARSKAIRSITPKGFAKAFYQANNKFIINQTSLFKPEI